MPVKQVRHATQRKTKLWTSNAVTEEGTMKKEQ